MMTLTDEWRRFDVIQRRPMTSQAEDVAASSIPRKNPQPMKHLQD